jgi:hypothetical protein
VVLCTDTSIDGEGEGNPWGLDRRRYSRKETN